MIATNPGAALLAAMFRGDIGLANGLLATDAIIESPLSGRIPPSRREAMIAGWSGLFPSRGAIVPRERNSISADGQLVSEHAINIIDATGTSRELRIALCCSLRADGLLQDVRIYHFNKVFSADPVLGPAPLTDGPIGSSADLDGIHRRYYDACSANPFDLEAVIDLFEDHACFETGIWSIHGHGGLRLFYGGSVTAPPTLRFSRLTDDGTALAMEFSTVTVNPPRAGLAVYQLGQSGKFCRVTAYDQGDASQISALGLQW